MKQDSPHKDPDASPGNDVPEDRQIELLATFDEALAGGVAVEEDASVDLDADQQQRFAENQQCLQLLEQLFPRRRCIPDESGRSAADTGLPLGQALGRFTLVRELGRGGFGVVYLAEDPALGRQVALKVPRANVFLTPDLRQRFLREAQSAGGLNHPNLVRVLDAGQAGLLCFIVSDYCPGPTLAAWLKTNAPCRLLPAARIVAAVAHAVAYMHSQGILHRDIKPSNILLVPSGETISADGELPFTPRLTDFGLARLMAAECTETASGTILGTPAYMAPEQAHGRAKEVGCAADVYSLGAVLYELCTGQPPFAGTHLEVLARVVSAEIVSPRQLRPNIPRDLEAICLKCLQRDPAQRYSTAQGLSEDLENFIAGRPTVARPAPFWKRGLNSARRRPAVAVGVALGALMLLGVTQGRTWFLHQQEKHQQSLSALAERDQRQTAEIQQRSDERDQQQTAEIQRRSDERDKLQREHDYVNGIRLAAAYSRDDRAATMGGILNPLRPAADQEDIREFAWHYLWRQAGRMAILPGDPHRATAVVFADEGLLSVDNEGHLNRWDLGTRRFSTSTSIGGGRVAFSADGTRLATSALTTKSQGRIAYRDARTGALLDELAVPVDIHHLAISPDGRRIAVGGGVNLHPRAGAINTTLAGDVNGDGRSDVVHVVRPSELGVVVAVHLSNGDGSWAAVTTIFSDASGKLTKPPLLADMNGDGRADLLFTSIDSDTGGLEVHTASASASGALGPMVRTTLAIDSAVLSAAPLLGDVNADGCADLIFAWYDSVLDKTVIRTAASLRDGAFAPLVETLLNESNGLLQSPPVAGDVNGDGLSDLVFSLYEAGSVVVRTALGRGDGTFDSLVQTTLPAGIYPNLTGDVNRDGKADLIFTWVDKKSNRPNIRTAASLGDGTFTSTVRTRVGDGRVITKRPSRAGDINGDGLTDLIFTWHSASRDLVMRTALGRGDGTFATSVQTVLGGGNAVVMLWEPATGRTEVVWESPQGLPTAMKFSPGGDRLGVGSKQRVEGQTEDNWVCEIVDLSARKTTSTFVNGPSTVSALAFSADESLLAIAGAEHHVKVWDLATAELKFTFTELGIPVSCLEFSPDGELLAAGMYSPSLPISAKNTLGLWDLTNGARYEQPSCREFEIVSLAFAPDGKTLALGCHDDAVRLCDLTDIRPSVSWPAHAPSEAWGIAFAPGGAVVATSGDDHLCKLWDLHTRQEIARCTGAPSLLVSVAFAPHQPLLATAGYDGAIRLFNADTGEEQAVLAGHQGPVRSLAFNPTGELLASAGDDRTVKLWNAATGELASSLTGHTSKVHAVAFAPDGKTLYSGGHDDSIKQWQTETGECLQTFAGTSDIESLAHSPRGHLLAVGRADGDVELRDSRTGDILRRLKGHTQGVRCVAYSPDGKSLASGGLDKTVRLWHLATGQDLLCFDDLPHQVNGVAFSADGHTLGATYHDGSARLWQVAP